MIQDTIKALEAGLGLLGQINCMKVIVGQQVKFQPQNFSEFKVMPRVLMLKVDLQLQIQVLLMVSNIDPPI